ncbi:ABC-type nitrate/sulfonate/bicarbonate transport system permease component [Nonomuraea thailandensis]|uniref:ABC-type nitrate/sulfonate/bicarbonate transport system permease component n=1 Tax=Nonomuraea thailandensis TaxID=1188745 RepID=A0A9X2GT07_9ACTN|nr:ABC transporter permease [Nonomuraea thailandensis]MCP2361216.1 ABC-type nitrate/sulfonate/bicarbonate transport system permease component [Nonomuraea thailandensis]
MSVVRRVAWYWLLPVAVAAWELVTRALQATYFPPPSQIVARLHELWFSGPPSRVFLTDEAVADLVPSLSRLFAGWSIACAAGVLLGVVLGRSAWLSGLVEPLVHFGRSVPPAALLPVFLVLFKVGTPMQLASIVYGVVWPVLINSMDGARHVDRQYIETGAVYRLSSWQRLTRIILPAAAPKIFAGLRLSVSLALIMMVISELVGSSEGIGHRMLEAQSQFDIPAMWAGIVLLGLLGIGLNAAFLAVERAVLGWHTSARTGDA